MSDRQSTEFDGFATPDGSRLKKRTKRLETSSIDGSESESVHSSGSGQTIWLSDVPSEIAKDYLSNYPKHIEEANQRKLVDIIPNFQETPEKVLKSAYRGISKFYNLYGYPTSDTNEATTSRALNALLKPIVWHFRKRGIDLQTLRLEAKRWLKWKFKGWKMSGRMDYSAGATGLSAQTFMLAECKAFKFTVSQTLRQCFLYLKRVWEEEEGGDQFAIGFNGTHFILVGFINGQFKISPERAVVFRQMAETNFMDYYESWKANHSELVKAVFTILFRKLEIRIGPDFDAAKFL